MRDEVWNREQDGEHFFKNVPVDLPLMWNFSHERGPIGHARVSEDDAGNLVAECEITDAGITELLARRDLHQSEAEAQIQTGIGFRGPELRMVSLVEVPVEGSEA